VKIKKVILSFWVAIVYDGELCVMGCFGVTVVTVLVARRSPCVAGRNKCVHTLQIVHCVDMSNGVVIVCGINWYCWVVITLWSL